MIILIAIIVLVFAGIVGWEVSQKAKIPSGEGNTQKTAEEVFSLSGAVSSVDAENYFLMVKPANQEQDVKVVLSETTKLIRLEFSFDPKNPPAEGTFTPTQTEIKISDFKTGDNVFIKAKENIAGEAEFDSIDFIQILP